MGDHRRRQKLGPVTLAGLGCLLALLPARQVSAAPPPDPATPNDAATVAAALVEQALRAEARGLVAERSHALELAVRADPDNPRARGLLGQVADNGRWARPELVAGRSPADVGLADALSEYQGLRAASPATAAGQRALADWCERHGLAAEAVAHLTALTRLDPGDDSAWRRLGYRRSGGRWVSPEQADDEAAEAAAQARADRLWLPRLRAWKAAARGGPGRDEALHALEQVRDPRVAPAVVRVFDDGSSWGQAWAVRLLGRVDSPGAAQGLTRLAVFGGSESIRRAATDRLARVDPRTFVGLLINHVRSPVRYEVGPVAAAGSEGVLTFDAGPSRVRREYETPPTPAVPTPGPGDRLDSDAQGRPVLKHREEVSRLLSNGHYGRFVRETTVPVGRMAEDARRAAVAVEKRLEGDVRAIERENFLIEQTSARAVRALVRVTGYDLGNDQRAWAEWWTDRLGYRYERPAPVFPRPTVVQRVTPDYVPTPPPMVVVERQILLRSCFGAGTPVVTRSGLCLIERVEVGDLVLAQNTASGALTYRPVVAVFHNRPAATLRVSLEGGESLNATGIHRFWRPGSGWVMVRDLVPGDRVRTLGGTVAVTGVAAGRVEPVYNLEVARDADFFVGQSGAPVHDNSLAAPTPAPFDAVAVRPDPRPGSGVSREAD